MAATSTDISKPQAVAWKTLNNGYGVTQFYFGLPYPDGATYLGGTQDNGIIRGTGDGGKDAWASLHGGDGGCVAVDPGNTKILYAENVGLSFVKSTNGGTTWAPATSGIDPEGGFNWIAPLVMDPSNASTLWTAGTVPWRTTNGATNWVQAGAAFLPRSPGYIDYASSAAVAPTDSNYVLLGLQSGAVAGSHKALTENSSNVWSLVRPVEYVAYTSSVTFDPTDKNIAYATYANFGVPHVWKSTDGGTTFSNTSGFGVTGIPDIPVHSIVVDPTNTSRLYIGTDLGVFTSIDGGANWAVENTGFANVITESLSIIGSKLFAFTYGRGAYSVVLPCAPSATALCLNGGRFRVTTKWTTPDGQTGAGQAVNLTSDTGYFWFFSSNNVEMVTKVVDGRGFNSRFWVFAGGLTNVKVVTTVTDTQTGAIKTYTNPQGTAFQPIQDTDAFPASTTTVQRENVPAHTSDARASTAVVARDVAFSGRPIPPSKFSSFQPSEAQAPCVTDPTTLCLNNSRFRVQTQWTTAQGQSGAGQAASLTSDTGYFWFFSQNNVEMVVKAVNGCGFNSSYWAFAGGLTNVRVVMTVTDTQTGAVKTYTNPQGVAFQPIQDTAAFPSCP
jgi:hypothetical protein